MISKTFPRWLAAFAALAMALFTIGASAQRASDAGEPTIAQIYQAANGGELDRANAMIDKVLHAHPKSAKAHYVKAELAARGRQWDLAHEELAKAETIAPGLPFAKSESVQALRNQLANATKASTNAVTNPVTTDPPATRRMGAPASGQRSFPWGTLAIVALIVFGGVMLLRRRTMEPAASPAGAAYGYEPMPQQQPSMGSTLARGLGTGLAVGAGVVAAEEIGRRMFGHGEANAAPLQPRDYGNAPTLDQIDDGMRHNLNTDMGGDDFGIADDGWDSGDWDS